MGDYFKPWRRKIGVLTLVLACVFAAGWVRSPFVQDTFIFPFGMPSSLMLVSGSDRLIMAMFHIETDEAIPTRLWTSEKASTMSWHWNFAGTTLTTSFPDHAFSVGDMDFGIRNTNVAAQWCQLPHWTLVVPLTLLSVYLLLSQPRKREVSATISAEERSES